MPMQPAELAIWESYRDEIEEIYRSQDVNFQPVALEIPANYQVTHTADIAELTQLAINNGQLSEADIQRIYEFMQTIMDCVETPKELIPQLIFEGANGQRHLVLSLPGSGER